MNDTNIVDIHHRKPKARGGKGARGNKITVPKHLHIHYHALFQSKDPNQVAKILNETWIDPNFLLVVVKRDRQKEFSGQGIA